MYRCCAALALLSLTTHATAAYEFLWQPAPTVVDGFTTTDTSHPDSLLLMRHENKAETYSPSLVDTIEMAMLSDLIYSFKDMNETMACSEINNRQYHNSSSARIPISAYINRDWHCHWYNHESQILLISSISMNYVAIVFAGTDNIETSLTDLDIFTTPFGNADISLPQFDNTTIRVHKGFNSVVFGSTGNVSTFQEIQTRLYKAIRETFGSKQPRVFTTGHSLGAAASVLAAVGLRIAEKKQHLRKRLVLPPTITSISFGCPQLGNYAWSQYVQNDPLFSTHGGPPSVAIWRLVLGWDLVPRLPANLYHAGHTIQLYHNRSNSDRHHFYTMDDEYNNDNHDYNYYDDDIVPNNDKNNITKHTMYIKTYYNHYGNATLDFVGVPFGWSEKPYIWVPGAVLSHFCSKYWKYLITFQIYIAKATGPIDWQLHFEKTPPVIVVADDDGLPDLDNVYQDEFMGDTLGGLPLIENAEYYYTTSTASVV